MSRTRLGGVCWVLVVLYFVAQPVVAAAWPDGYDWSSNYISDLGAARCEPGLCSPRHLLMDAAFVLSGLLILVGVGLLWPRLRADGAGAVGLVLVAVGGLGTVVVGLFPADSARLVHGAAAAVHIPAQAVGLLLVGLALRRHRRAFATATVVCAAASLVGVVLFLGGLGVKVGWLGVGGSERLADYPFYAWIVLAGVAAVVHRDSAVRPS